MIDPRTNDEKLAAVRRWQADPHVHALTCIKESAHEELIGVVVDGKVVLQCPTCHHIQKWIPDVVLAHGPPPG